jgi:hypothetical protein
MSVLRQLFPHEVTFAAEPAVGHVDVLGYTGDRSSTAACSLIDAIPQGSYLHVAGWAIDASLHQPAGAVLVSVDGVNFVEAGFGLARDDVAQHYRRGSLLHCGFAAWVPTSGLAPGSYRITVVVLDYALERYAHLPAPEPITIVNGFIDFAIVTPPAAGSTAGVIDAIFGSEAGPPAQPGSTERLICLGSDIVINGWAVDLPAQRAAASLYIAVNGREYIRAQYGLARQDVAEHLESAAFLYSGFTAVLSSVALGLGTHTVRLIIVSADGRSHYVLDGGRFSIVLPADFWQSTPH